MRLRVNCPRRGAVKSGGLSLIVLLAIAFVVSCSNNRKQGFDPVVIPAKVTDEMSNPLPDLVKAGDAGRPLYSIHCALCHGADGKTAEAALGDQAMDLTSESVNSARDGKLFLVIKNGVKKNGKQTMPPTREITDEQIWQMVAYVRNLAKK